MARQIINTGTNANDGSGDTLRKAGQKINTNFTELYNILGGDSNTLYGNVRFGNNELIYEGYVENDFETVLTATEPTQDNIITLPDSTGEVILDVAEQDLLNKHLYNTKIDGDLRLHGVSGTGYYKINYEGVVDSGTDLLINLPDLQDSDTIVFENDIQTLSNKTFQEPTIVDPRIDSDIYDALGNKVLNIRPNAGAVNYLRVTAGVAGADPTITTLGDDTNIDMVLSTKGTGSVRVRAPLRLEDSDYNVNANIDADRSVALLNNTLPLTMTLSAGLSGQILHILNINSAAATITPTFFAQGTSFTVQPGAAVTAVYNQETSNSAQRGWYLIGMDSDGGLGNKIIIS